MDKRRFGFVICGVVLAAMIGVAVAGYVTRPEQLQEVTYSGVAFDVPAHWTLEPDVMVSTSCGGAGSPENVELETVPYEPGLHVCTQSIKGLEKLRMTARPFDVSREPDRIDPAAQPVIKVGTLDGRVVIDDSDVHPDFPKYAVAIPSKNVELVFFGPDLKTRQKIIDSVRG